RARALSPQRAREAKERRQSAAAHGARLQPLALFPVRTPVQLLPLRRSLHRLDGGNGTRRLSAVRLLAERPLSIGDGSRPDRRHAPLRYRRARDAALFGDARAAREARAERRRVALRRCVAPRTSPPLLRALRRIRDRALGCDRGRAAAAQNAVASDLRAAP